MSRSLLIVISVLIVAIMGFLGFGVAYAFTHTGGSTGTVQATPTNTPVPTVTTTSGTGTRKTGTIQSITGQTIVITLVSGKSLTVTVTDQTTYTKHGGGQATLSDLQVGAKIRVQGTMNKQTKTFTADSITLVG